MSLGTKLYLATFVHTSGREGMYEVSIAYIVERGGLPTS